MRDFKKMTFLLIRLWYLSSKECILKTKTRNERKKRIQVNIKF